MVNTYLLMAAEKLRFRGPRAARLQATAGGLHADIVSAASPDNRLQAGPAVLSA